MQFFDCKNITIEDVFITNGPFWCIHLLKSENIICIRYDAKGQQLTLPRNLLIENIEFNNGDDNVQLNDGIMTDGKPVQNIIIRLSSKGFMVWCWAVRCHREYSMFS